jgi:Mrp family chromosome partitioning ATPase
VFNLKNALGLTSVVVGHTVLSEALTVFEPQPLGRVAMLGHAGAQVGSRPGVSSWQGRLRILPSGPPPPDPGEVVASRRLAATLGEVASLGADYVLVDAPPVLSVGDAAALAGSVDGVLMVVSMDKARRESLARGREVLESVPARKLGVVIVGERVEHKGYYRYGKG